MNKTFIKLQSSIGIIIFVACLEKKNTWLTKYAQIADFLIFDQIYSLHGPWQILRPP